MAGEITVREKSMGVLRRVFGPSRKEIWTQLSTEIGAQYEDGGFWKGDKVIAAHGAWKDIQFEVKDDEGRFGPQLPGEGSTSFPSSWSASSRTSSG
jgi:hypothetical protein